MKETTKVEYLRRVQRVQSYIEKHLSDRLIPLELSKLANLSPHHFHRIFRGITGESILEYVRRLKLERSARRLRTTEQKVIEIALDAGYDSHEGFTRAFRQYFGVSPSEFRGQMPISTPAAIAPPDQIEIRAIDSIAITKIRHTGSYDESGKIFPLLISWAESQGIDLSKARVFGLCFDDPEITPAEYLRFDACIEYEGKNNESMGVSTDYIPAGRYAVATHIGAYTNILDTYLSLIGGWVPRTDYELCDEPVVEYYLDDPRKTLPEEMRTELWIRLQPS
jgi:AraC family transcriptional regulator